MAPPNSSAKTRKTTANKAAGPKPIVPAIPLPYMKRQIASRAAATATTAQTSTPDAAGKDLKVSSPAAEKTNGTVTGTGLEKVLDSGGATDSKDASPNVKVTKAVDNAATPSNEVQPPQDDIYEAPDSATTSNSPTSSAPVAQSEETEHTQPVSPSPKQGHKAQESMPTSAPINDPRPDTQAFASDSIFVTDINVKHSKVRPPAPISPARYQMPPPFHPANGLQPGITGNGDVNRAQQAPVPNGPFVHHSHHSNGSAVHFGTFNGSANSSPAPPHSGGIAPPPGMQMHDGRHSFMAPPGIGYPPMMPLGNEGAPMTQFDGYSRPGVGYAPSEVYQAHGNHYGPSTPHSLHGSQSSGHVDDGGAPHAYQPGQPRGVNGFSQDYHGQHRDDRMMSQEYARSDAHDGQRRPLQPGADDSDGLLDYMRQVFGSPELSDTTVELRYLDNRAAPVRIPGHRLILARSSAFAAAQMEQSGQQHVVSLATDSKWVRSDAFYMAFQRLYGLPLLPVPPPMSGANGGEFVDLGSQEERLHFALAYAAAGHLLQWEPVLRRGSEIAAQLLTWQTLTKTLQFALEGFVDKGTYETYRYGPGSEILLHSVAAFVASNLTPTYVLDTTAAEAPAFSRLPLDPGVDTESAASKQPESVLVQATQNGRSTKGHRHQLSNIQFGDLSLTEGQNGAVSDTPKASQQARPVSHAMLSQVLVSLPFGVLRLIFDPSGPGHTTGWANTEGRARLLQDVVSEREARRNRVVKLLKDGRALDRFGVLQQLRSPEPRDLGEWGILGWQEEVVSHGSSGGLSLGRRWVPDRDGADVTIAEFP